VEIQNYLGIELGKTYNVEFHPNGKEALEAIYKNQPDLIISDVMMPVMDGIELTRTIKRNVKLNTLPVILLTAKTRNEDNIAGLDAGADAYISKPFNIDVLLKRVATLIDNYSRLKKAFDGSQTQEKHVQKIETVSNDDKLMERMMKIINENLSDPELTVERIADKVGLSRVHLYRKIKEITNQSPKEFIRNYRLNRAAELLVEHKINVAQISDQVGFSSPNNFSTAFKKLYGMTPSEYVAKHGS
jgi:YesN/AraC family two-component response regulator